VDEKNVKCYISAAVLLIVMKFGTTMHISPSNLTGDQKWYNARWQTAVTFKIIKLRYPKIRFFPKIQILTRIPSGIWSRLLAAMCERHVSSQHMVKTWPWIIIWAYLIWNFEPIFGQQISILDPPYMGLFGPSWLWVNCGGRGSVGPATYFSVKCNNSAAIWPLLMKFSTEMCNGLCNLTG